MRPCPVCNGVMAKANAAGSNPRRRTVDHMLPQVRGGQNLMYGDTRNTRIMCQACNQGIEAAGYCIAAFACATDVARSRRVKVNVIMREWRFGMLRLMTLPEDAVPRGR